MRWESFCAGNGGWPQAIHGSRAGSGIHFLRTADSSGARATFHRVGRWNLLARDQRAPRRWSSRPALPIYAHCYLLSAMLLPVLALLPCPGGALASPANSSRHGKMFKKVKENFFQKNKTVKKILQKKNQNKLWENQKVRKKKSESKM